MNIVGKATAFVKWHFPALLAAAVIIGCAAAFPSLFAFRHLRNILCDAVVPVVLACGLSVCMAAGYLDFAAAQNAAFASVVAGALLQSSDMAGRVFGDFPEAPFAAALLAAVVLGAVFSLLPILTASRFRIPPLLLSVLSAGILHGGSVLISSGFTGSIKDITGFADSYTAFAVARIGPDPVYSVPWIVVIACLTTGGCWYFTARSRMGIALSYTAPGLSGPYDLPLSADVASEPPDRKKKNLSVLASSLVFPAVISGSLYGLSGFIAGAREGAVSAGMIPELWFTVFAGCLIGGMSVFGGRGSSLRASSGVLLCAGLNYVFSFVNAPPGGTLLFVSFLAALALCLDVIQRRSKLNAAMGSLVVPAHKESNAVSAGLEILLDGLKTQSGLGKAAAVPEKDNPPGTDAPEKTDETAGGKLEGMSPPPSERDTASSNGQPTSRWNLGADFFENK